MAIRLPEDEEAFPGTEQTREGTPVETNEDLHSVVSFNSKFKESALYKITKYLSRFKIAYVPVLNWCILLTFLVLLYRLIHRYEKMYKQSAVLTTLTTNTLLFGLSDTLAQNISCFLEMMTRHRNRHRLRSVSSISLDQYQPSPRIGYRDQPDDSFYTDYGDTRSTRHRQNSVMSLTNQQYQLLSEQTDKDVFNFRRFLGFVFWGSGLSFVQVGWYWVLNHFFTTDPTFVSVLERVLSDQLFYSPISLFCFFTYSNFVLEGGDKVTLSEKISKIYLSTLLANWCVWPLVQFINFLVMPRRFQVPFSSSIGVIWNCFLSMRNAAN